MVNYYQMTAVTNGRIERKQRSRADGSKEWRSDTWKEKEVGEGRMEGRTERRREPPRGESEMAEMERKRNRLG